MVKYKRVNYFTPKVLTLGFLSLLLLSACQQSFGERFTSEKGVKIESLLPADTFLFFKLGSRDGDQLANLKTLNGYFSNNPMGALEKGIREIFRSELDLEGTGLEYQKDIAPMIGSNSELYFAFAPMKAGDSPLKKYPFTAMSALTLANSAPFELLIGKQVEKNMFKKADYNGQAYYILVDQSKENLYVTCLEDTVFLTDNEDDLKNGVDNWKTGKNLFAKNSAYQKIISKGYQPSVAFLYLDFAKLFEIISTVNDSDSEFLAGFKAGMKTGLSQKNALDKIESEILLIKAESEGLRFLVNIAAKDGSDLIESSSFVPEKAAYLAGKIPAQAPIFYGEGSNLNIVYKEVLQSAEWDAELKANLSQIESFLKAQNLDLEKDILSFLDKNFALVFEDNTSMIPSFGFYADISSNSEAAVKLMTKIDQSLVKIYDQANKDIPGLFMFLNREEVLAGKLWKFKLNLSAILAQTPPEVADKFKEQKVEFYYGVLPENILVFALKPDLEKIYGKSPTVSDSQEFKKTRGYFKENWLAVSFAPAQLFVYMDRLIEVFDANASSMEELIGYQNIKAYISPLKSFSFGNKVATKEAAHAEIFLHISK